MFNHFRSCVNQRRNTSIGPRAFIKSGLSFSRVHCSNGVQIRRIHLQAIEVPIAIHTIERPAREAASGTLAAMNMIEAVHRIKNKRTKTPKRRILRYLKRGSWSFPCSLWRSQYKPPISAGITKRESTTVKALSRV